MFTALTTSNVKTEFRRPKISNFMVLKKQTHQKTLKVKCKPKMLEIFEKNKKKYWSPWAGFEPTPTGREIII